MMPLLETGWQSIAETALLATPVLLLAALMCRSALSSSPALRHSAWLAVLLGVAALPA